MLMIPLGLCLAFISHQLSAPLTSTGPSLAKNELEKLGKSSFWQKLFFHNSSWNWGGLEVSRVTARTVRRQRNKFSRDLVLHGIEKSTFQHFSVNLHFKVLEMALKTFHFVPGLSRTPLFFLFLDISPTHFSKTFCKNNKSRELKNLKISNPDPGKSVDSLSPRDGPVI